MRRFLREGAEEAIVLSPTVKCREMETTVQGADGISAMRPRSAKQTRESICHAVLAAVGNRL
jgi:hypothetical protein